MTPRGRTLITLEIKDVGLMNQCFDYLSKAVKVNALSWSCFLSGVLTTLYNLSVRPHDIFPLGSFKFIFILILLFAGHNLKFL